MQWHTPPACAGSEQTLALEQLVGLAVVHVACLVLKLLLNLRLEAAHLALLRAHGRRGQARSVPLILNPNLSWHEGARERPRPASPPPATQQSHRRSCRARAWPAPKCCCCNHPAAACPCLRGGCRRPGQAGRAGGRAARLDGGPQLQRVLDLRDLEEVLVVGDAQSAHAVLVPPLLHAPRAPVSARCTARELLDKRGMNKRARILSDVE